MAKVTTPNARLLKQHSFKGRVYFYVRNGNVIAARWPRKRGKAKTIVEQERQDWFGQAQRLAKRSASQQIKVAMEATAGTPLMTRDTMTAEMAGRMFGILMPDGRYYRGIRAVSDVSESLDIITNQPGQILIRGQNGWTGAELVSGIGNWFWSRRDSLVWGSDSTTQGAFKGNMVATRKNMTIYSMMTVATWVADAWYKMVILETDNMGVINGVTASPTWQATESGKYAMTFEIEKELIAEKTYLVGVGRTDGGNSYVFPIAFNNVAVYWGPFIDVGAWRLEKENPAIGDTPVYPAIANRTPIAVLA